jgi:hypothetical protein
VRFAPRYSGDLGGKDCFQAFLKVFGELIADEPLGDLDQAMMLGLFREGSFLQIDLEDGDEDGG